MSSPMPPVDQMDAWGEVLLRATFHAALVGFVMVAFAKMLRDYWKDK
jgi:hypothetical protein